MNKADYSRMIRRFCVVFLFAIILAGCATGPESPGTTPPVDISDIPEPDPHHEPLSASGNPVSYKVFGQQYHVLLSIDQYETTGIASWYGGKFHGQLTASGEVYDMYQLTAAHKTLPLPSYVRVTNLENGHTVIVRVNDRGPFHDNRIIDLSYAAAVRLGMAEEGTAKVRIKALTLAGTKMPNQNNPELYLQTGAFANSANAHEQTQRLKSLGIGKVFIKPAHVPDLVYRVRIGPFSNHANLVDMQKTLEQAGMAYRTLRD